ncbi:unknown [Firmicutes bacterium CAG:313]|nr:unknown [Firmicutes bacterium CAG:313]
MNLITAPSGRVPPFNSQFNVNSAFGLYHLAVTVTSPVEPFAIVSTLFSPLYQPKNTCPSFVGVARVTSSSIVYDLTLLSLISIASLSNTSAVMLQSAVFSAGTLETLM